MNVMDAAGTDAVVVHRRPLLDVLRSARHRHLFVLTLLGAVAQYGGAILAAGAGGWVVGAAVEGRTAADLTPGGVVVLVGVALAIVGQWLNAHMAHAFAFRHQAALRLEVYDGLERSAPRPVLGRSTGEVAAVVMGDVDSLEQAFAHLVPTAVSAAVVVIGSTVALATIDWRFAVILAAGAIALAVVPSWLAVRAEARGHQLREELGRLNAAVVDGVRGLRELVLLRQVDAWSARIAQRTRSYARVQRAQARADGMLRSGTDVLVSAAVVVTLVLAVALAADGSISLAAATLAIVVVIAALRPVVEAVAIAGALAPLRAAASRVLELIDQPERVPERVAGGSAAIELADTSVSFDHVDFAYEPGRPVLAGATFTVAPGEMVALVGASGAGKTTCVNLLLRFWDVDAGAVRIGGHDVRDLPLEQLRAVVGIVPQQVHLFTGTVADNLRIGAPEASDEKLIAAARIANADEFISALPDGYGTQIGENGARLSGGQRQRLAIARAILHDAPVLVLDEAASNLDSDNEQAIHAALRAARHGRTTVVVAHRLSTIRAADRIVVLRDGRVVETGTHDELSHAGGDYARLVAHQHDGVLS